MDAIATALQRPFPAASVGWKPQTVRDGRCLAVAYIDARDVMDRLDEVAGPDGWQDAYEFLADGSVLCRLRVRLSGEWVEKSDVGGESEQPDGGDRRKAAVSDALKRAAVKFGIGRYLYRLDQQWVDFDAKRRAIPNPPRLPDWALPEEERRAAPPAAQPRQPAPPAAQPRQPAAPAPAPAPAKQQPAPSPAPARPAAAAPSSTPAEICAMEKRLRIRDKALADARLASPGELYDHVLAEAEQAGFPSRIEQWNQGHANVVAAWVVQFEDGAAAAFKARAEASQKRALTGEEAGRLSALLAAKGLTLAEALPLVSLPATHIDSLTLAQASKLAVHLKTLPDLEPVELG